MSLPASVPTGGPIEVPVSGGTVHVLRGLTWGELQRCRAIGNGIEADAFSIACCTGEPIEVAREWATNSILGDVQAVVEAIFKLSGADDKARFPG